MKQIFTLAKKPSKTNLLPFILFFGLASFVVTKVNGQACALVTSASNLIQNGSFESNTNRWSVTNGSIYTGTGYQVCGSRNGYVSSPNNGTPTWAFTDIPLQPAGTMLNLSGYFGTHAAGQSCSPIIRVAYYNSSWTLISADTKNITTNVDVAPYKAGLYVINTKVPANTSYIRFETRISCDYIKIDAISMTASNLTLPVQLISFQGILKNNQAELTWRTASELNVGYFILEKSLDGSKFDEAGLVFANGNSTTESSYKLTDNLTGVTAPVVYYRLRSVDNDGKSQLSDVRIIRLEKQASNVISILTYPSPASSELRVTIPADWQGKQVIYEIFSINGQLVSKTISTTASQTEIKNIAQLQSGIYSLRVTCEGKIGTQKIIKQ